MQIKFKKLSELAKAPFQAKWSDAGYNLYCVDGYILKPWERRLFPTNIWCEIPIWFYGRVAPRSGMAYKIWIHTLAGVIDSGYRGDIWVILINLWQEAYEVLPGDKIAQFIITPCETKVERVEVEELDESEREWWGRWSTGR